MEEEIKKFKARKFKEDAYSRNEDSKTIGGFPLGNIISEDEESYEDYADTYVKLRIAKIKFQLIIWRKNP